MDSKKTQKQLLSSEECQILLEFENAHSLHELAGVIGRDHSVIARLIKRISSKHPVVEKKDGKWCLTAMGKALNETTRNNHAAQLSVLKGQSLLRIGTNIEFANRVLGQDFTRLHGLFADTHLSIHSYHAGAEEALLTNQIDIGIDCDRPNAPDISFKMVADEGIVVVASPSFKEKHKKVLVSQGYQSLPHLLCTRLQPEKILKASESYISIFARFNDIATTRAVCISGLGWALLPLYAVKEELKVGKLVLLDSEKHGEAKYGIWWLRKNTHYKPQAEKLIQWLSKQSL